MRDVLEDVEPRDVLRVEQSCRVRFGLLQDGGDDVAGLHFLPARALHVQHGGLQHALERGGLFRFALAAALLPFDRRLEVGLELLAQRRQIGAARRQDLLALLIVRQRVQQVLERQVGVAARHGFAVRHGQDDLE